MLKKFSSKSVSQRQKFFTSLGFEIFFCDKTSMLKACQDPILSRSKYVTFLRSKNGPFWLLLLIFRDPIC